MTNPLNENGGNRIWDTGSFGRDIEELVEYLIVIGLMILIAKFLL